MRRRKHRKDYPSTRRVCPCCGSKVRRVSPQSWRCLGCDTWWFMDGHGTIGEALRRQSVGWGWCHRYVPVTEAGGQA